MGVYDELQKISTGSPTPPPNEKRKERKQEKPEKAHLVDQSIDRPTNRPVDQSTKQSTDQLTDIDSFGPVVDRPRAFYITQKVDRWLDEAVWYLREKGMHKVDRSVLLNALIHDPALYKPKLLDGLRKRLLAHLTNRTLRRARSTE